MAHTIKPDTGTNAATASAKSLGAFRTSSALALLWEKASPAMDLHTLQWFSDGACDQIAVRTMNLSGWVEGLACLILQDDTAGSFQEQRGTSELLFSLASEIDGLHGMAEIAVNANFCIRQSMGGQARAAAPSSVEG